MRRVKVWSVSVPAMSTIGTAFLPEVEIEDWQIASVTP